MTSSRSHPRGWRFRTAAVLTGVAAAGLVAEVTLRMLDVSFGMSPMDPHPILHHWHPSNMSFTFRSESGEYDGFRVDFNNVGMVSSRPFSAGERGIVVLGDSFVEAGNLPEDARLTTVIERVTGTPAFNLGMSSFSPLLHRLTYEVFRDRIAPVAVVQVLFANDLEDDEYYEGAAVVREGRIIAVPGATGIAAGIMSIARRIYTARLVAHAMAIASRELRAAPAPSLDRPYFPGPIGETVAADQVAFTEEQIRLLADAVAGDGARLYVTTVPDRGALLGAGPDFLNDHFKAFAARAGIDYIDLVPAFSHVDPREVYFAGDIHWNPKGHALAGRLIANRILEDRASVPLR